jgi:hypothetical protein
VQQQAPAGVLHCLRTTLLLLYLRHLLLQQQLLLLLRMAGAAAAAAAERHHRYHPVDCSSYKPSVGLGCWCLGDLAVVAALAAETAAAED